MYTQEILEYELRRLSSAPRIVPRLAALVKDPNMNPEDVIDIIRHDPALTTRVIGACKSAAVNHGGEVSSVIEAVQCLGFNEVYRIAVVVAFRSGFCSRFNAYETSSDQIWQQAVAAACFMEEFAIEEDREMGTPYTIGLLHMIGMFLIDWHCAQIPNARISCRPFLRQLEQEREHTGFTHMEVSAMPLEFWGFPRDIVVPIRCYAYPEAAGDLAGVAAELQLAVSLAQDLNSPSLKAALLARTRPYLSPAGTPLETFVPKVQRRLQTAMNFLKL